METKIKLCDRCKKRVMDIECDICGCDLCEGCRNRERLMFNSVTFADIFFCGECNVKINNLFRDKERVGDLVICVPNFKQELIYAIKKNLLVFNLGDKEEDKE